MQRLYFVLLLTNALASFLLAIGIPMDALCLAFLYGLDYSTPLSGTQVVALVVCVREPLRGNYP